MPSADQRRFKRVSLNLPVRVVINTIDEVEGRLVNISPGSMALIVESEAVVGDAVVAHIQDFDIIEGTVARLFPDGVAISFILSKKRREQLAERLVMLSNPGFAKGLDDRRSTPRHRTSDAKTICRLEDGTSLIVKVIDLSVNGVSVDAPRRPAVGSPISIGRDSGVVARHTPRGFVIVYDRNTAEPKATLRAV